MAEPQDPRVWRHTMAPRLGLLAGVFAVCVLSVVARLVYLQVFRYEDYAAKSRSQQHSVMEEVPADRGEILDRHGRVLATSVEVDAICAAPVAIKDPSEVAARLCGALGDCDAAEQAGLVRDLQRPKVRFVYVRRGASPQQAHRVADLKIDGVFLKKEPRRYYPNRQLAANVLGFVGRDNKGLNGLESTYDSTLRGTPGHLLFEVDGRKNNRKPFNRVGDPPVPGQSLELTIDATLQHIAERELQAGVEENRALGGSVVILGPRSGEILAMASAPFLNANLFGQAPDELKRNRPVQDIYEPGSTFKIVTASAALQEHLMRPTDLIDTGNGTITIGNRVVDEYKQHRYGTLSFTDVIVKSSNVGAIRIGFRIGAPTLARYVGLFGFGTRLSPDFPSENAGLVWRASQFTDSALASVSMGYQVSVTPLQMACAASTVANGGELVQPRVVRAVIDGNDRKLVPRRVLRRVISEDTAAELTSIMEGVVARGTATKAALVDFTVAGKTGTSNKNRDGHYVEEYNASFVGFVPSRSPVLTILVHIDTPRGPNPAAGGAVAAPIFHRIADAALRYLGVPSTINPVAPVLMARHDAGNTVAVSGPSVPLTIVPAVAPLSAGQVVLPDLRGLSLRDALRLLARLGITPRMTGDGVVTEQEPVPGTPVDIGGTCRLALGRPALEQQP